MFWHSKFILKNNNLPILMMDCQNQEHLIKEIYIFAAWDSLKDLYYFYNNKFYAPYQILWIIKISLSTSILNVDLICIVINVFGN